MAPLQGQSRKDRSWPDFEQHRTQAALVIYRGYHGNELYRPTFYPWVGVHTLCTMPKPQPSAAAASYLAIRDGHARPAPRGKMMPSMPPRPGPRPDSEERTGMLLKMGLHTKAWRKRWFILRLDSCRLVWYAEADGALIDQVPPRGQVEVVGVSDALEEIASVGFAFDIWGKQPSGAADGKGSNSLQRMLRRKLGSHGSAQVDDARYRLAASSEEEAMSWVTTFKAALKSGDAQGDAGAAEAAGGRAAADTAATNEPVAEPEVPPNAARAVPSRSCASDADTVNAAASCRAEPAAAASALATSGAPSEDHSPPPGVAQLPVPPAGGEGGGRSEAEPTGPASQPDATAAQPHTSAPPPDTRVQPRASAPPRASQPDDTDAQPHVPAARV